MEQFSGSLQRVLCVSLLCRMMLQHSGPTLADISCSALVPCLSPPGSLTLDDFTNFSPIVKEELRLAIHSRRRSAALAAEGSDGSCSSAGSEQPSEQRSRPEGGARREVSRRNSRT